ncbi:hypothetical protein GF354_02800 [Candidatus Peregrinibacteria bacterium]|nr:hypothetical protein [Candidatus Peregrinibacteria bacterium]
MNTKSKQSGFTLIELIVYIAIAMIVLISATGIIWNIFSSNLRAQKTREVYTISRQIMSELTKQIHSAEDVITASSNFNTNPGTLTLDFPGGNTNKIFDTYEKTISINGREISITKLRLTEGSDAPIDLSSDQVTINNFTLENLTYSGENKNINISLNVSTINPDNDSDYDISLDLETSVSVKKDT